jgi:hypothetical protein
VHHGEFVLPVYGSLRTTQTVPFTVSPGQYVRVFAPTVATTARVVVCADSGAAYPTGWTSAGCGPSLAATALGSAQNPPLLAPTPAPAETGTATITSIQPAASAADVTTTTAGGGGSLTAADGALFALLALGSGARLRPRRRLVARQD